MSPTSNAPRYSPLAKLGRVHCRSRAASATSRAFRSPAVGGWSTATLLMTSLPSGTRTERASRSMSMLSTGRAGALAADGGPPVRRRTRAACRVRRRKLRDENPIPCMEFEWQVLVGVASCSSVADVPSLRDLGDSALDDLRSQGHHDGKRYTY